MTFTRVCALADLDEPGALSVDVGDRPVAVVRSAGEVYAVLDICSHADVPLSEGEIEGATLECWLHGSRFDLRTGKPTGPPATIAVPTFAVRVDGDDIYVDTDEEN